ncbi:MAG: glycosyltransferase [Firmicutes bacterium]|nr:glycosyltransferase [Bacillota bacterium]
MYGLAWVIVLTVAAVVFLLVRGAADRGRGLDPDGRYTFILLVFNQEERIEGLIWELRRLRDRYPTFDLVVVDQGSTDRTAKMLERLWRENEDFRWTVLPEGVKRQWPDLEPE